LVATHEQAGPLAPPLLPPVFPEPEPDPPGGPAVGVGLGGGLGVAAGAGFTVPVSLAFPFLTTMPREYTFPDLPLSTTFLAEPLQPLSHTALDLGLSLEPAAIRVREQVQVTFPILIFWFLKISGPARLSSFTPLPSFFMSDMRKSGTHWHPEGPPSILLSTSDSSSSIPFGQTFSVSGGQPSLFIGQTLVNPGAHLMAMLCIGQLQSQSHWLLPSGQSHLQEHCISSFGPCPDPGPVGDGPEPDPFPGGIVPDPDPFPGGIVPDPDPFPGGIVPDPDPFPGGIVPDPDPFPGGIVPDPDPFPGGCVPDPLPGGCVPEPFPGGFVPDPDPVGCSVPFCPPMVAVVPLVVAAVVGAAVVTGVTEPLDSFAAPFLTAMSKTKTPDCPFKETLFATPLHFLSHEALDLGLSLVPTAIRFKVHVQVALPTRIFAFLNTSANAVADRISTMAAILILN